MFRYRPTTNSVNSCFPSSPYLPQQSARNAVINLTPSKDFTMVHNAAQRFMKLNVTGRVFCACRAHGVGESRRIAIFTRAVEAAISAAIRKRHDSHHDFESILTEQLVLLSGAFLQKAAINTGSSVDDLPLVSTAQVRDDIGAQGEIELSDTPAAKKRKPATRSTVVPKAMEEKLQEARKPLQKLLLEDCVHLGLLTRERAEEAARSAIGRTRDDAEKIFVVELRNNLHQQVRSYIRKHKGGPWPKPKDQDGLRLDIVATRSVQSVLMLARQVLRERTKWEQEREGGVVRNLLGGKLKLGFMRTAKT